MTRFPNVAGVPDIDDTLAAELEAAGIEVHRINALKDAKSEVCTAVIGGLHGWSFKRAWYYWRADGPGIERAAAERLHATHGRQVRVAGHCGCPSPTEWFKGLAVDSYHVDTAEGLKALADTIRSIVEGPHVDLQAEVDKLRAERDEARETNRSFHRRLQQAEAPHIAMRDYRSMVRQVVYRSGDRNGPNETDSKVMLDYAERAKRAEAEVARLTAALAAEESRSGRLAEAIESFGHSGVRDRVVARVGCNQDILHDALQQEVRRTLAALKGSTDDAQA